MNLSSKRVDFSAKFPSTGGRLVVQVFVFTQAGEISIDGEKTAVTAGTVKFNILVESWGFCGYNGVTCTKGNVEQQGEAIDFTISVKGKGDRQVRTRGKRTDGEEFDRSPLVIRNVAFLRTKKVLTNGKWNKDYG